MGKVAESKVVGERRAFNAPEKASKGSKRVIRIL